MAATKVESPAEVWKDVPNFEGHYQVSNYGRVRSLSRTITNKHGVSSILSERILRPTYRQGYVFFSLYRSGKMHTHSGHALVMLAFVGPKPSDKEVNHINAARSDNFIGNLEYVTHAENMAWQSKIPQHLRVSHKLPTDSQSQEKTKKVRKCNRLSREEVLVAKELRAKGMLLVAIARTLGVNTINVYRVFETGRYDF